MAWNSVPMPASWHIKVRPDRSKYALYAIAAFLFLCIIALVIHEVRLQSLEHFAKPAYAVALPPAAVLPESLDYGVVVDAGSSGSRVFVYAWPPHTGNPSSLLQIQPLRDEHGRPIQLKIEPGLSAFVSQPSNATKYMEPLFNFAAASIPEEKHHETPIYILATAGLRLLPESERKGLLENLRMEIPKKYKFLFSDTHVEMISGRQEGVYQWIAINYVLGRFDHSKLDDSTVKIPHHIQPVSGSNKSGEARLSEAGGSHVRQRTVGIIDMGGGSVQVAYELYKQAEDTTDAQQSVREAVTVNLGCQEHDTEHEYHVYVSTFLGYGANIARKRYEQGLIKSAIGNRTGTAGRSKARPIRDPCLPVNLIQDVYRLEQNQPPTDASKQNSNPAAATGATSGYFYLKGTGNFAECRASLLPLLNTTRHCANKPCSFNGVHQPPIDFTTTNFYGFSEYWYTFEDVLRMGSAPYRSHTYDKAASDYCATKWSTLLDWYEKKLYPKADWYRFRMQCFKSAWITLVLHAGLKFPSEYKRFRPTQLVRGQQPQWTLGALLYRTRFLPLRTIESHWQHKTALPSRQLWLLREVSGHQNFLLLCIFVVTAAIFLYICRLRRYVRHAAPPTSLRSIPSMSYYMVPDSVERDLESGYSVIDKYDTRSNTDPGLRMLL